MSPILCIAYSEVCPILVNGVYSNVSGTPGSQPSIEWIEWLGLPPFSWGATGVPILAISYLGIEVREGWGAGLAGAAPQKTSLSLSGGEKPGRKRRRVREGLARAAPKPPLLLSGGSQLEKRGEGGEGAEKGDQFWLGLPPQVPLSHFLVGRQVGKRGGGRGGEGKEEEGWGSGLVRAALQVPTFWGEARWERGGGRGREEEEG